MGAGSCSLQGRGEFILHEHVYQHCVTGFHQLRQVFEVEGERQNTERHEDETVGAQSAVELGGMWHSVGSVTDGAGAYDRHSRGQREC